MSDKEEIKEAMREALNEWNSINSKTHEEHHKFIDILIVDAEVKKERVEKIKTSIIGWGFITGIGSIVGGLGYAVTQWVKSTKGGG